MKMEIKKPFLSFFRIIPESPRWLLAVGQIGKARAILTCAAKRNKIPMEKVSAAIDSHESHAKSEDRTNEKYNITHLFKTPNMRVKTICIATNWFVCGICYFGLAQYISQLDGNIFINVGVSGKIFEP